MSTELSEVTQVCTQLSLKALKLTLCSLDRPSLFPPSRTPLIHFRPRSRPYTPSQGTSLPLPSSLPSRDPLPSNNDYFLLPLQTPRDNRDNSLTRPARSGSSSLSSRLYVRAGFSSVVTRFPALQSLNFGRGHFSTLKSVARAPLRSLSYSPSYFHGREIESLSRLPLVKLELKLNNCFIEIPDNFQPSTTIRTLEELTFVKFRKVFDENEWNVGMVRFIQSCPRLRRLKLVGNIHSRSEKFLESLVGGAPLLTKLEFDSPSLAELSICHFIHLYPRFPNLTYLSLTDGMTAPNLASHLRRLLFLTTLRLGPEAHFGFDSPDDFLSLVQASTKPPALELLILECFRAKIGHRCRRRDTLRIVKGKIDSPSFRFLWSEPIFTEGIVEEEECRQLLEMAGLSGVRVEGDIQAAVNYSTSWNLELANRHILQAYQSRTLERLKAFKESNHGQRFPELDLENLNVDNLKLVKIDLPEEDWYQFTLE
ncbi:hypothetical protein JCM3765_001860 [Sporobolomyces pararoseus]